MGEVSARLPFGIEYEDMGLQFTTDGTDGDSPGSTTHDLELGPVDFESGKVIARLSVSSRDIVGMEGNTTVLVEILRNRAALRYTDAIEEEGDGKTMSVPMLDFSVGRKPEDLGAFVSSSITKKLMEIEPNIVDLQNRSEKARKRSNIGIGAFALSCGYFIYKLCEADFQIYENVDPSLALSSITTLVFGMYGLSCRFDSSDSQRDAKKLSVQHKQLTDVVAQIETNGVRIVE